MTTSDQPPFSDDASQRDAGWVAACLDGDADAFAGLVRAYERRAVATAYRFLGNSHEAAEVAQEAFLRAYRALGKLEDPRRFGPWLLRIVSNLSLNARRSRKSGAMVPLDETRGADGLTGTEGEPMVAAVGPDREAEAREMQTALDEALATLPEKQRQSLVLFTVEGWAQKDIAEHLGCTVENVKWNVFQARKKLREILGDKLDG